MKDIKVDLVYLWVNGNDKNWQETRAVWAKKCGLASELKLNNCRYTDNQELRYSLRSAEMYAPWINKIFIITNGQVPKWLNPNHPKIRIVNHSEIIPKDSLPTFNSEAIETCIANIDELSEYFLLSCDDKFFASPVKPSDFFDENNNPIVKLRPQYWEQSSVEKSLYKQSYLYSVNTFKSKFQTKRDYAKLEPFHCIEAYRKSYFLECKNVFSKEFDQTTKKRFRAENSIQHPIVDIYMLENKNCKLSLNIPVTEQIKSEKVENLYLAVSKPESMQKTIDDKKPKLLCINDGEQVSQNYRNKLKGFLENLYPEKQDWELELSPEDMSNNTIIQYTYCFNRVFVNEFLNILSNFAKSKNCSYDLTLISEDIKNEDKNIITENLPKNVTVEFYNADKIGKLWVNKEEMQLTEKLINSDKNDRIVFWGASLFIEEFIEKYFVEFENILGIIDINPSRKGEHIGKYEIFSPDDIKSVNPDKIIVTVINDKQKRVQEISQKLISYGIKNTEIEAL